MNHKTDIKKEEGSSCSCGSGSCGSGQRKWIWLALAAAVIGVLIAKEAGKKPAMDSLAASGPPAAVAAGSVAAGQALPRLVDLGAGQCPSCKMMTPILADLKKMYAGKMDFMFVDVWENTDAAKKYGVNVIPTQIFYDAAGNELFRHEGFFGREDILAKWKELGVELAE